VEIDIEHKMKKKYDTINNKTKKLQENQKIEIIVIIIIILPNTHFLKVSPPCSYAPLPISPCTLPIYP
jgi:hypothetical protein